MLEPMLYQKCRPETIDDYVFVDKDMEAKFREWINKGSFPNLIVSGPPGTGKCLSGNELIDVEIDVTQLWEDMKLKLVGYGSDNQYQVPIKLLFEILGFDNDEYESVQTSDVNISIKSPKGTYVPIRGFVKKNHDIAQYTFTNGEQLECSTKHIVFSEGEPVHISNTNSVDTVNGAFEIDTVEHMGKGDVYDVSLDSPHEYVTPNGIIHHNTTLSHVLVKEIGYDPADVKTIDCSTNTGIDIVRDRILPFVETASYSDKGRVMILEEFERLSANSQDALKCIIVDNMDNARFIMLTNNPHKVEGAIKSRAPTYHIEALDKDQYMYRVAKVLTDEGIKFDLETLQYYTDKNYPDMRGVFNDIERYTFDNELKIKKSSSEIENTEWMMKSIAMIQEKMFREARKTICENIGYHDYEYFYRLMYENLDWWADTDKKKDKALMIIKDHIVDDSRVGDREIVLASCLTALSLL